MSESYLPSHEWARPDAGTVTIGLSVFAAGEVGEIIHVGLPKVGAVLRRGVPCAEIESVKSVNDFYSPVDGEVVAVNPELAAHPELVNQDPLGKGWFAKVKPAGAEPLAGLLSSAEYLAKTGA
jgi:glycine cleavage system H protein